MRQSPKFNNTHTIKLDNPDRRVHQLTLLLSGNPPAGAKIGVERKAVDSELWIPVRIGGKPAAFDAHVMPNDSITISMMVSHFRLVPNDVFKNHPGSQFGYKLSSWRS